MSPAVISSLLRAFVGVDGSVLVMRAGDTPYVVAAERRVDFPSRRLSRAVVEGVLDSLLPPGLMPALDDIGCVRYDLPRRPDIPDDVLTMFVERSDTDLRVEFHRKSVPDDDAVPDEIFAAPSKNRLELRPADRGTAPRHQPRAA